MKNIDVLVKKKKKEKRKENIQICARIGLEVVAKRKNQKIVVQACCSLNGKC